MADDIPSNLPPEIIPVLELAEPVPEARIERPTSHKLYWVCFGLGTVAYIAMFFVGGFWTRFAAAGLQSLPFLLLAVLAYAGEQKREFRALAFAYFVLLMLLAGVLCLLLSAGGVIRPEVFAVHKDEAGQAVSAAVQKDSFYPGGPRQLFEIAAAYFGIGLLGLCLFLPNVRRSVAGLLPTYADSFVHAIAVATVVTLIALLFVPLMVLGQPPVLLLFQHLAGSPPLEGMSNADQMIDTLAGLVWLVPSAILAVGYPYARTIRESLVRVGLVRPTVAQVVFAVVAALALVYVMTGVDHAISWFWRLMDWPATDTKTFEELMKFGFSLWGALVIGVTAGLGEELFARGVLQPRLGIVLSNLLFTAAHALQYNWDGLVSVFLIGLVLGVIRKKTNTTTSAIVHGTYDFTLLYGTYLGWF